MRVLQELSSPVRHSAWDSAGDAAWDNVMRRVKDWVADSIWAAVDNVVATSVTDQIWAHVWGGRMAILQE